MPAPMYDRSFFEDLVDDVEAFMHRSDVLTDFAESQVEERIRLARLVNQFASERDELQLRVDDLQRQVAALEIRLQRPYRSMAVRLTRAPRRLWRTVRRGRSG